MDVALRKQVLLLLLSPIKYIGAGSETCGSTYNTYLLFKFFFSLERKEAKVQDCRKII